MHQHTINASIQIVPIVQDRHPYLWVDEAIAIIQQSGIKHEVGPFTFCGLAKVAIFTTKLHTKNRTSIIRKIVIRSTEPPLLQARC